MFFFCQVMAMLPLAQMQEKLSAWATHFWAFHLPW